MFESADTAAWALLEGHTGEYPFVIRYRQIPPDFLYNEYPKRLNVFWTMERPDENGFPSPEEAKNLDTFENRLVAAVEQDESAWLVAIITGRAEREFVFYLQQPQRFLQHLTNLPQEQDPYPIEIHCQEDPDWSYFDKLAPIER